MATVVPKAGPKRVRKPTAAPTPAVPREATELNVYGNTNPNAQHEVLDGLPVLVFLERAGKIVFANSEARQMLGLVEGEWIARPVEDVLWGLFPGTAEPQTLLTGTRHGSPFHATLPAPNGRLVPVEGTYSISNAQLREAVIVAHPSEKERAPKSRLMEDVLSSLPEAVAIEHQNHVLYTNPAFTRMFGYTAEEAGGGSLRELIVPETRLNENATLLRVVDDRQSATAETVRTNKAGELVDVSMQIAPLLVDGARVGYVFTFRDIGELKQTEAKLQHDAMHDVLTGLPNRALFLDRLNLTLTRRLRHPDNGCGVLYLDLDNFKAVNDSLGHAAGDVLLMAIAGRLRSCLRPQDSAARLGGDEFAVLVENIVTAYDLEVVAGRILQELGRPLDIFGHTVYAGASIGAAMAGADHTSSDLLLRDADFAMYRAKQGGRGRYEIFDKHLEVYVTSQQERERELRTALDKRQFTFLYQPIYRLANGKLEGFESLLCVRRADGTVEDFDGLLVVAEDTGLSIPLGRETLETVCAQLRSWSDQLPKKDLFLSINLTRRQLFNADLTVHLVRALTASGADPSRLVFEVPETALNETPDAAVAVLQRLTDCQVRVAIDDFGSSLAPLNHLLQLPISMVKLASRLTAVSGGRQQAVLESFIRLSNALSLPVVAQGIETREQVAALVRMGCALGQGPLMSPALDPERALELAQTGSKAAASRA
ncbi:MAG TPA: EAL domain-containing protein [Terracidiphilus sp.]|nr:EAL domain-containing protein [Terracidiphilus sp.]